MASNIRDKELLYEMDQHMKEYGQTLALMFAAKKGNVELLKLFLKLDVGMKDGDGWTALMVAAICNNYDCAKYLLAEAGNADNFGQTALIIAA